MAIDALGSHWALARDPERLPVEGVGGELFWRSCYTVPSQYRLGRVAVLSTDSMAILSPGDMPTHLHAMLILFHST